MPWHTYMSPEGFPYYHDDVSGRTLWAAPNDWMEFYDTNNDAVCTRNSITGEVRRLVPALDVNASELAVQTTTEAPPPSRTKRDSYVQAGPLPQQGCKFDPSRYLSVDPVSERGQSQHVQPTPFRVPATYNTHASHKSERRARAEKAILAARASLRHPLDVHTQLTASAAWKHEDNSSAGEDGSLSSQEARQGAVREGWRHEHRLPAGQVRDQTFKDENGRSDDSETSEDVGLADLLQHGFRLDAEGKRSHGQAAAPNIGKLGSAGAIAPPSDLLASRASHFRHEDDVEGDFRHDEARAGTDDTIGAGRQDRAALPDMLATMASSLASKAKHMAQYVASTSSAVLSDALPALSTVGTAPRVLAEDHRPPEAQGQAQEDLPVLLPASEGSLPIARLAQEALDGVARLLNRSTQQSDDMRDEPLLLPKQPPPPERDSLPERDEGNNTRAKVSASGHHEQSTLTGSRLLQYLFRPDIVAASLMSVRAASQCAPTGTEQVVEEGRRVALATLPLPTPADASPGAAMDELAALCGVGKDGQRLAIRDPLQAEGMPSGSHRLPPTTQNQSASGMREQYDSAALAEGVGGQQQGLQPPHEVAMDASPSALAECEENDSCGMLTAETVWQRTPHEDSRYPVWQSETVIAPVTTATQPSSGKKYRAKHKVAWGDDTQTTAAVVNPDVLQEYTSLVQRMSKEADAHA